MTPLPELYRSLISEVEEFWAPLPDKPEETANGVLRALWLTAAGTPVSVHRSLEQPLPELDASGISRLHSFLDLKKSGVPLGHITERQNFLGIELIAGPGALIPRKETEILGRSALARLAAVMLERGEALVVDVCTGSGNLALAMALHEPQCHVFGADLSADAVALARRNCVYTGVEDRVEVRQGDLIEPFNSEEFVGKVDLLTCNPPYISAAKVPKMPREISAFEPALAFNGGAFGVSILSKLIREAPRFLKSNSWMCFEVGLGQGSILSQQLQKNPAYSAVETHLDSNGEIRALSVRRT